MSEKDIKTKPQYTPKVKSTPKTVEHSKSAVKDIKAVSKDILVNNVIKKRVEDIKDNNQSDRAEVEATENVESTAYNTTDAVYHKGKSFVENKVQKLKQTQKAGNELEPDTIDNAPKTASSESKTADNTAKGNQSQVKTKENYLKAEGKNAGDSSQITVKTKENYLQANKESANSVKVKDNVKSSDSSGIKTEIKTTLQARREYVSKKLKIKAENDSVQSEETARQGYKAEKGVSAPKEKSDISSPVKTKESYMQSLQREQGSIPKSPYRTTPTPKEKAQIVSRNTAKNKVQVKSRVRADKAIKTGNAYTAKTTRKPTFKATKRSKTQKEVTKKAKKEAAKKAKVAAQKAAQAAKATARAAKYVAVKIAQLVVKATKALVSALAMLGGWAVLLVVLIVVIIIAAIAASPFGIFISTEVNEVGTIPLSQIVAEYNVELTQQTENIELSVTHNEVEVIDNMTDNTVVGTVSGMLFAIGMCMVLLPEWNAFKPGVVLGSVGLVLGLITILIWRKMVGKEPIHISGKNVLSIIVGIVGACIFGIGMCFCMVWNKMVMGIVIGMIGIVILLCVISLTKDGKTVEEAKVRLKNKVDK